MEDLFEGINTEKENQVARTESESNSSTESKEEKQLKWRDEYFKEKKEKEELKAKLEKRDIAFKELGFNGDVEEEVLKRRAERSGQSVEEIKAERDKTINEAKEQAKKELQKEYEQRFLEKQQRLKDLAEIKAKYPDVTVEDTIGLGKKFITLMATGYFTPLEAYEASKPKEEKIVSSGSTKGGVSTDEDYFSPEEVSQMTRAQVKKNFSKIEKSMEKWNKK